MWRLSVWSGLQRYTPSQVSLAAQLHVALSGLVHFSYLAL